MKIFPITCATRTVLRTTGQNSRWRWRPDNDQHKMRRKWWKECSTIFKRDVCVVYETLHAKYFKVISSKVRITRRGCPRPFVVPSGLMIENWRSNLPQHAYFGVLFGSREIKHQGHEINYHTHSTFIGRGLAGDIIWCLISQKRYEIDTWLLYTRNRKWMSPIESCHCQWPWSTFKVMCQALK